MSTQNLTTSQEDPQSYQEPSEQTLLPPADFKPFFTIIESPITGECHHPAVHYIFADDDQDHLTNTLLDTSEADPNAEVEERVVVLDLAANGSTVLNATSLSPQWQALTASLSQAPTWGNDNSGSERRMLKITGHERYSSKDVSAKDVEGLASQFSRRLAELERALEVGTEEMTDTSKRV